VDADEFAAGQRAREWFHALTVPPGAWAVIRERWLGKPRAEPPF
jgi:hypothetical protein